MKVDIVEITKITRSYIIICLNGRTAKIDGEGFSRALSKGTLDYVDFVIYVDSLINWDEPWEDEPIPVEVKELVINFIKEDFKKRGQTLALE